MSKKIKEQQRILDEAKQRTEEISKEATEAIDNFVGEVVHRERPHFAEIVSTGASFHEFKKEPVYEGSFLEKFLAPKDMKGMNGEIQPKGTVIGFTFVDEEGKLSIISKSHSITEALEKDGFNLNTKWWIEFQGKVEAPGKRPFNRFFIAKVK